MYIHEAIKEAMKSNSYITVPELKGKLKIQPTNEKGNCIIMNADGTHPSKYGWQPMANDLIRDDWVIDS